MYLGESSIEPEREIKIVLQVLNYAGYHPAQKSEDWEPYKTKGLKWLRNIHNIYYQSKKLTSKDYAQAVEFQKIIPDAQYKTLARYMLDAISARVQSGNKSPLPFTISTDGLQIIDNSGGVIAPPSGGTLPTLPDTNGLPAGAFVPGASAGTSGTGTALNFDQLLQKYFPYLMIGLGAFVFINMTSPAKGRR